MAEQDGRRPEEAPSMEQILYEIKKVIVGQDHLLERVLVAVLSQGHLLVEGVPGLAKTLTIKTLAEAIHGTFKRVQFTPDLVADEITRAPAKVQSALLEVMQERQVTIGGETHKVREPFLVMATQNPIETEGTYPLPEAQVDRFMMKVVIDYPSEVDEFVIVERMTGSLTPVKAVATTEQLCDLRREVEKVYVDPSLIQHAVRLATATRDPEKFGIPAIAPYIMYGASPRASINLILSARALAFVRGRSYAVPQDITDMALDVMRHRLVLSFEALSDGVNSDMILQQILERIPPPAQSVETYANASAAS